MRRIITIVSVLCSLSQAVEAQSNLFIATSDFSTGSTALLPSGAERADVNLLGIHSDAVVRYHGDRIYVVNRLGQDNIIVLDAADARTPLVQFSVGNGANPQDIAVVAPDKAYIALYERSELLIVDPRDGSERGRVDLSAFADGDGLPEIADLVHVGSYLYASCQRLDRNSTWGPADDSFLAVIDIEGDELVDVDSERDGIQGILLSAANPNNLIAVGQRIVVSGSAHFGDRQGGIELIDTQRNRSLGRIIGEEALGGDLNGIALVDGDRGFAVISDETFTNYVRPFNLRSGEVGPALQDLSGGYIPDIAVDGDRLIVADQGSFSDPSSAGLKIFDAFSNELRSGPISTGLPPVSIAVLSDAAVRPTAIVETQAALPEWSALGNGYPNPFNASIAVPFTLDRDIHVQLVVLDILGRAVRTLQDGLLPAGSYSGLWNGRDADGRQMGNGTYFVRLSTESMRETTKVMLIK